jgi:bla regulator protein blaR1
MKKILIPLLFMLCFYNVSFAQEDTSKVYSIVDRMPQFPGGDSVLKSLLEASIRYPLEDKRKGNEGIVYVTFVIDTIGRVTHVELLRSAGQSLDDEAVRVVKGLPLWAPGSHKGKKVRVQYHLPVKFTLTTRTELRDFEHSHNYAEEGTNFLKAGEYDKAIQNFSLAIAQDKSDIDSYYNRAVCYFKKGNNADACADLQKAKELGDKQSRELFLKLCGTPPVTIPPDTVAKENTMENPSFPGGNKAFSKYIDENLIYPEEAAKKKIEGTVEVSFTIDENGKITNATIVKSLNESCDAEALRFVNTMPGWVPGKQNGKPISFQYNLPLQFYKKR